MNSNRLYRALALSLAFLIAFTSIGFSLDLHFCQERLKSVSLFGEAKTCHDIAASSHCKKLTSACKATSKQLQEGCKKNCCHNETIVVDSLNADFTNPQLLTLQTKSLDFVLAFVYSYCLPNPISTTSTAYLYYKPPLPERDFQVLFQTFLI